VERVHALSKIDPWFLSKLQRIVGMGAALVTGVRTLDALTPLALRRLKRAGFSDRQIASRLAGGVSEADVRRARLAAGIRPVVKQIDTLAAEFPAQTNYLYMTYAGTEDDVAPVAMAAGGGRGAQAGGRAGASGASSSGPLSPLAPRSPRTAALALLDGAAAQAPWSAASSPAGVMVLGCGPYCIGSSVEFDWCAVSCVRTLRAAGLRTIMVNSNPETVSTDYDESERLYFEELSLERALDIYEHEGGPGVIVSVGGQIPNNLAMPLHRSGVRILGTSPVDIDRAEDRNKFSQLLDAIGVDQPPWK
jgi:hypothetical protein